MHSVIAKPHVDIFISDNLADVTDLNNLKQLLDEYFSITNCLEDADIYVGTQYEEQNKKAFQIILNSDPTLNEKHNVFAFQPFLNKTSYDSIDKSLLVNYILTIADLYRMPRKRKNTILRAY